MHASAAYRVTILRMTMRDLSVSAPNYSAFSKNKRPGVSTMVAHVLVKHVLVKEQKMNKEKGRDISHDHRPALITHLPPLPCNPLPLSKTTSCLLPLMRASQPQGYVLVNKSGALFSIRSCIIWDLKRDEALYKTSACGLVGTLVVAKCIVRNSGCKLWAVHFNDA